MTEARLQTLDGGTVRLPEAALAALRSGLRGALLASGDPGYDAARAIWNAAIDRRPALIVQAAGAADVVRTVNTARDANILLAVKGGGHNISGNAVCEGGLMLDLSHMRSVRVDPARRRAWIEPGATLSDVDKETQAFSLAVPTGINSTTGIAGLTLGGGFGWITRKFGMTIDNLRGAHVVTADGRLHHVDAENDPDLFWALRGGGGNFGVVTSFEFQLHALGPQVLSGVVVHPFEDAAALLRAYRRIVAVAPDELTCWVVMRKAPPLPFIPAARHGREVLIFAACYSGAMDEGGKALAELRSLGRPIVDVVSPHPFTGWQAAFDPLLTPGARNYWKSHDFIELSDGTIAAMLDAVGRLPTAECEVFIAHVGGAMSRVEAGATAYPQRRSHFIMNVHTRWRNATEDDACIGWARATAEAAAPYATGSVYVNFMPGDERERVPGGVYAGNYARLAQIKRRYDPGNLFRMNHNIEPAA